MKSPATLVVTLSYAIFAIAEGLPTGDTGQLDTRDLGDYINWFWSSTDSQQEPSPSVDETFNQKNDTETDSQNFGKTGADIFGSVEPVKEVPENAKIEEVDDILAKLQEEIQDSNREEVEGAFNFLENLKNFVSTSSSEYVKVTLNEISHLVRIGGLGTPTRTRGLRCIGGAFEPFSIIMSIIYSILGGVMRGFSGGNSSIGGLGTAPSTNASLLMSGGGQGQPRLQNQTSLFGLPLANGNNQVQLERADTGEGILKSLMNMNPQSKAVQGVDPSVLTTLIALLGGNAARNPRGGENSSLLTMINQGLTQPKITQRSETSPRIVVLNMGDDDDRNSRKNSSESSLRLYEITGSPEERLEKLKLRYQMEPDLGERILILSELRRLKSELNPNSSLFREVETLIQDLRQRPNFNESFRIIERNSIENPDTDFNGINVINGSTNGRPRSNENTMSLLMERINEALKNNQATRIDDPEIIRTLQRNIDFRRL